MGESNIRKMGLNIKFPEKGSIYLVSLEPVVGREIGKTRPALIISNDRNNEFSDTVTLIPITTYRDIIYPFEVFLPQGEGGLKVISKIKCNQIRTVDKERLRKYLGKISHEKIQETEKALMIHLGIEILRYAWL